MRTLKIEFHSEWRSGTGRGKGLYVDAEARRDHFGLPMVPGKQLKGLIRHALETGAAWGHWSTEIVTSLCGQGVDDEHISRFETSSGKLSVSSARMTSDWTEYFESTLQGDEADRVEALKIIGQLFRIKRQTKITDRGLAQSKSLRSVEVCVPMTLVAELSGELSAEEEEALSKSLKLIKSLGGMTTRGLGRVTVSLQGGIL